MTFPKSLSHPERQREIAVRIAALQSDSRALWGRMNSLEMLCHLTEAFHLVLGKRTVTPRPSLLRNAAGRYFALRSPVPWMHGLPTLPELDMAQKDLSGFAFEDKKTELAALIGRFCSSAEGDLLEQHPFFGPMTLEEWMLWGYKHTDHHLRQFGCR